MNSIKVPHHIVYYMKFLTSTLILGTFLIFSCGKNEPTPILDNKETIHSEPNILLIIADDMGLDAAPGYAEGNNKPKMPNYSSLMNSGLKFNNVWSAPTCTPTRATLITGKYGIKVDVKNFM